MTLGKWITLAEAAQRLGKTGMEIRRWVAESGGPARDSLADRASDISSRPSNRDTLQARAKPADLSAALTEIDKLHAVIQQLAEERDYLRDALTVALTRIPPPPEKKPREHWWQVWR